MESKGEFLSDLFGEELSVEKIKQYGTELEKDNTIPFIHFTDEGLQDELVLIDEGGNEITTINNIYENIGYPLNRGPFYYASNFALNYEFKTYIIFTQDGLIFDDPQRPGEPTLYPWELWGDVQYTKHIKLNAPVILLANPQEDGVPEMSISPVLDLNKNVMVSFDGTEPKYDELTKVQMNFAYQMIKRFWVIVDKNRDSDNNEIPLETFSFLYRENFKTLNISNKPPTLLESDDIKNEADDNKGYPGIRVRVRTDENGNKNEKLNSTISKYLAKWQCPTESYNGRLGIEGRIPSWIDKIDTDDCCPQFSDKEIEFINNKILTEKIIPVLSYAPDEFYAQTKQPWWVVPLSIWAGDKASWIFIDKNGVYAAHPADEDIAMIFPWDRLTGLEYHDEDFDTDEEEIHSIDFMFDEGELTLVEFVPPGQGSYLSVIESIYEIRKKTIEESAGQSSWAEGAGGEGYKSFEAPSDLLDKTKWDDPHRPKSGAFGGGFQIVEETKNAEYYYKQGEEKYNNKDNKGAIEDFTRVIENDKADANSLANSYRLRGDTKFRMKDWKGAIADFDEIIKIAPNYAHSRSRRGSCKHELKNYKGALEDLTRAIEIEPTSESYCNRGNTKKKLGDLKGAIEDYQKSITIDPDWFGNYNNIGEAKYMLNDFLGAIEYYNKAIERETNNADVYTGRGKAKMELKEYESALDDYNKGIELDPNDIDVYTNRGKARSKLKDFKGAIEDYNTSFEKGSNRSEYDYFYWRGTTFFNRGLAKHDLGLFEEAIKDYNKAIIQVFSNIDYFYNLELAKNKLESYHSDGFEELDDKQENVELINAYFNQAKVYLEQNHKESAIKALDIVIKLNPTFTEAYYTRAGIRYDLENYDGAIADYSKTIILEPNHKNAYSDRGYTKGMLNDFKGAIIDLTKAIDIDSGFTWAYQSRGDFKSKLKNYDAAILDYDKSIELNPKSGDLYQKRGNAKKALKDFQAAIIDFSKAIELSPNNDNNYYYRGFSRKKIKDYKLAIEDFSKAMEIDPEWWAYYSERGEVKFELENYESALKDLDKAIELNQKNDFVYRSRGKVKLELKDYESALEDLNKACELDPEDSSNLKLRDSIKSLIEEDSKKSTSEKESNEKQKAIDAVFEDESITKDSDYFLNLAKEKYNRDNEGALEELNKAIELNPDNPDAYFWRGSTKNILNDFQGALEDHNKAIEIRPDDWVYYKARGKAKRELEDFQGAIEDFSKGIELSDNESLYELRGDLKKEFKDLKGAIEDFSKAIDEDPDWWEFYSKRGDTKKELKDFQGALEDYNKAIELDPQNEILKQKAIDAVFEDKKEITTKSEIAITFNDAIKAYEKGNKDIVVKYIEQGNLPLQWNDDYLITKELISYVCASNEVNDHIRNAVSKGVNLNETTIDDECGYTAVHFAVWDNKLDILEYLLEAGAKTDIVGTEDGLTPLYLSAVSGHYKCVKMLLDYNDDTGPLLNGEGIGGLRIYFSSKGATAMRAALINAQFDIVELLITHGADFNELKEPCVGTELPTTDVVDLVGELAKKGTFQDFDTDKYNVIRKLVQKKQLESSNQQKGLNPDNELQRQKDIDAIFEDEKNINIKNEGTKDSKTKIGNILAFNDFDTWISEIRNGQEEDKEKGFKKRKPQEIPEKDESIVRNIYDKINERYSDEEGSLTFSFSPTGGCTISYKKKKLAGLGFHSKGRIGLGILRDYKKGYVKPNIKNLYIENIREKQVSYQVPWGYAFYSVIDLPDNIDKNIDLLIELVGDGIDTINEGKVLSLKKDEFPKLKLIFEGEQSFSKEAEENHVLSESNTTEKQKGTLQDQLAQEWTKLYPDALVKKINKDPHLDIHMPSIHPLKGTHIWFNTPKDGGIRVGFYCRKLDFIEKALENYPEGLEKYSSGIRLPNHPKFDNVADAIKAGQSLVDMLSGNEKDNSTLITIKFNSPIPFDKISDSGINNLFTSFNDSASFPYINQESDELIIDDILIYQLDEDEEIRTELIMDKNEYEGNVLGIKLIEGSESILNIYLQKIFAVLKEDSVAIFQGDSEIDPAADIEDILYNLKFS